MSLLRHLGLAALLGGAVALPGADEAPPSVEVQAVRAQVLEYERRALAAEEAGSIDTALRLYRAAHELSPGSPVARRGVERTERILGIASDEPDLQVAESVRRQLAAVEFEVALARAAEHAEHGRFLAAREAVLTARSLIESYPDVADEDDLAATVALVARYQQQAEQVLDENAREQRQDAQREAYAERRSSTQRERSTYHERLGRVVDLKQRGHYEVALVRARDLVADFPGQREAEVLHAEILGLAHERRRLTTEERMRELKLEVNERIRRSMIPTGFDGTPRFPHDWHERAARREQGQGVEELIPEWQAALQERLSRRVDLRFEDTDPIFAIETLAEEAGINLVVDTELRVSGGPPVNLRAVGMRAENALDILTERLGVSWTMRDQAVWVGGEIRREPLSRAYDITEFLYQAPDLETFEVGLSASQDGGAGGGFDIFGGGGGGLGGEVDGLAPEDVVDLIQRAVAPDLWDASPDYQILIRNNWLMVTAPGDVHALIREFLDSQSNLNNTLVRLKLRWVEITDDFMEEIGMDWDNAGTTLLTAPFRNGITELRPEYGYAGSLRNNLPSNQTGLGPSLTSGLQLQWVQLALPVVSAIFRAEHRKRKARFLDGIELTTLSGVQSSAFFGRQVAYIEDYEVAAGGNLDPQIGIVTVGQSITVKPYVSADRKYVTMDLQPTLADVSFFTEQIATQTIAGRGPGSNGVVFTSSFPIELPNLLIRSAGTRVMIPHEGTILVGGFGRATEQYAETQIPILGHIPFLGRLFGMRGQYSSRSQLYLMVEARVILYDEEEARQ